jgi:hypothetical protein
MTLHSRQFHLIVRRFVIIGVIITVAEHGAGTARSHSGGSRLFILQGRQDLLFFTFAQFLWNFVCEANNATGLPHATQAWQVCGAGQFFLIFHESPPKVTIDYICGGVLEECR